MGPTIAVHEIMSASPVIVGPTTSVSELLALFDRHDFNAFPVVDGGGVGHAKPFAQIQKRLGRKRVTREMMAARRRDGG